MEILFFIVTIFFSLFVEVVIGIRFNLPNIGCVVGIALVGTVILYAIRHKK